MSIAPTNRTAWHTRPNGVEGEDVVVSTTVCGRPSMIAGTSQRQILSQRTIAIASDFASLPVRSRDSHGNCMSQIVIIWWLVSFLWQYRLMGQRRRAGGALWAPQSLVVPTILHKIVFCKKGEEDQAGSHLQTEYNHHPAGRPQIMNGSTFLIMTRAATPNRRICWRKPCASFQPQFCPKKRQQLILYETSHFIGK
jgi:hypothetical protein